MLEGSEYKQLFIDDKIGEKVLLDLTTLFYDRLSYAPGDSHETAFREGQRSVVTYILQKTAQINFLNEEDN